MERPRAVACQSFAGAFDLGATQAGFQLVHKVENKGGFGMANCEANRHLTGDWTAQAVVPTEWEVPSGGADVVIGNPPCSGFSVMTSKHLRGEDAKINQCMWDFVEYAARVNPLIAIFESVTSAYSQGIGLMRALRRRLVELTGEHWDLHHVVHDAYAVGGPAIRKRYFWVASRIPFDVEHPVLDIVPLHHDVIDDLRDMEMSWGPQPYGPHEPSDYVQGMRFRREDGVVDGHMTPDVPMHTRIRDLLQGVEWNPREHMEIAVRRHDERYGKLPESFSEATVAKMRENDYFMGFTQPTRWDPERPSRVVTGAGPMTIVHYDEPRVLTFREVARILGYPDNWLIEPLAGKPGMSLTWGKGITVQAGRWIAEQAMRAGSGEVDEAGGTPGEEEREFIHQVKKPRLTRDIVSQPVTQA